MATSKTLAERIADLIDGKTGAAAAVTDLLRTASIIEWDEASRHPEPSVRAAAMSALPQRDFAAVAARAHELLADTSEPVTEASTTVLTNHGDLPFETEALEAFLVRIGDDAAPIVRKLGGRSELTPRLLSWLEADDYPLEDAAGAALRDADSEAVMPELIRIAVERSYSDATVLGLIDHHIGKAPESFDVTTLDAKVRDTLHRKLSDQHESRFSRLRAPLERAVVDVVDEHTLSQFGRLLSAAHLNGELNRAHLVEDSVQRVVSRLDSDTGSRCVAITGRAGTGKTALVHAVTAALVERGWVVIEVVPSQLMVGTKYLGEWETRVQKLIAAARSPKKVALVMPSVEDILHVGASSVSSTSVSSMLMPLMERGDLVVIGESDKDSFAKAAATNAAFRRLFALFELVPASAEATRRLVSLVGTDNGVDLPAELVEQLLQLADGFVTSAEQPGRTLSLLRRALLSCPGQATVRDLLELLSESTGAPVDFLDHNVALDLNETRRFLESRVVGQPAAISAVLDTVTMIKAGLTDPGRPNGVMLFVGPTGVGKTELARALAKFLFGEESRLFRFDMSEFASYESYERLIGSRNGGSGLLTEAVHLQPFSVVLLDEIEKAHANVFDLLLQVFDAGRLTDGRGRTVDFRNTVIILTSNVGARMATRASAGFTGAPDVPTPETIQRALEQQFRPEFLGRIDRIVNFLPLSAESAERIVRREITSVLRRTGITTRRIAVDVDPDVVGLLLTQGYSPAYGARPLKRAIESRFLLPLARAIASGAVPAGAVIAVGVVNGEIAITTVRDTSPTAPRPEPTSARRTRSLGELQLLMTDLEPLTSSMADEKARLLSAQGDAGFWDDRRTALVTLDRVQRLDRLLSDAGRLQRDIERTERNRDPRKQASYLAAHVREYERLHLVLGGDDLRDAAIFVERIGPDEGLDAVGLLLRMYQGLASRLHLDAEQVDDVRADHVDRAVLLVNGPGAARLLHGESGLHRFRNGDATERRSENASVRVAPFNADSPATGIRTTVEYLSLPGRIGGHKRARVMAHASDPTMGSLEIVVPVTLSSERSELEELAASLLVARRDAPPVDMTLVRRYDLGPSPVVTDLRTGHRSGRVGDVLAGNFDVLDERG